MTALLTDEIFLDHETGQHPERPERLRAITSRLDECGLIQRCTLLDPEPIEASFAAVVHDEDMIELVQALAQQGGGILDADTVVSRRSFDVALHAAGAAVAAVNAVLKDQARNALCLIRPPGHHATPDRAMGFCLLNNIAIAAEHARRAHGVDRILIVDFDVHHGNGTQDIFYEDANVTFLSIHRYGFGFYPGTGSASETGRGEGLGHTINVPVPFGTGRRAYLDQFDAALERAAKISQPELVLVSAGFDAHRRDPIGSLGLETEDMAAVSESLIEAAKTYCSGRLVSCLEGGYDLTALAACVEAHLAALLHDAEQCKSIAKE